VWVGEEETDELRKLLLEFRDIFPASSVVMKRMDAPPFDIILEESKTPIGKKCRRFTDEEKAVLGELIDVGVPAGIVRKSSSTCPTKMVFVPKPSGEIRPCANLKPVNAVTKKIKLQSIAFLMSCLIGYRVLADGG
jgi:hypothetical protein